MTEARQQAVLRLGLIVFLILAVLAVLEFALSLVMTRGALPYLLVMNLIDAVLIAYFFQHVAQLWRSQE